MQYVENGKSTIKTLAVVDCAGKYSAAATMELVKKVMERYGLKRPNTGYKERQSNIKSPRAPGAGPTPGYVHVKNTTR